MADRIDYYFPFQISPDSRQARRTSYERHVAELIKQLLLTSPGERADLPEFGCGLRAMIFAGNSDALAAMTELLIRQSLVRWLSDHLTAQTVEVTADEAQLVVRIEYYLIYPRTPQTIEILVDR